MRGVSPPALEVIISITSPPLPVKLLTNQSERFEGVELIARAKVVIGELSPTSRGAMLTEPEAGTEGVRIAVFDISLATARYTFPKNRSAYQAGDRVWIKYVLVKGVLSLREVRPDRLSPMTVAGGVLLLMVGLLQAYKSRKKSMEAR
ncbi:MAG: hypothetical protein U9P14_09315 [Gemmatimonadota bacterium]|nr:hypothetical protein [Gemmatimonadota bacterium]